MKGEFNAQNQVEKKDDLKFAEAWQFLIYIHYVISTNGWIDQLALGDLTWHIIKLLYDKKMRQNNANQATWEGKTNIFWLILQK